MSEAAIETTHVEQLPIARVYADALWRIAVEQNVVDDLFAEYQSLLAEVLDKNPDLEVFLGMSSISNQRRGELIDRIFQGRSSELLLNFLHTLNRHDRLGLLRTIGICLNEFWEHRQGKVPVIVRSAVPLEDAQLEKTRSMIAKQFGIDPDLRAETDPDLLGGLWIRIGDRVYDRSVRWNLLQLRETILTRSANEIQSGRDIVDRSEGN